MADAVGPPLSLASFDQLMDEIHTRYPDMVVIVSDRRAEVKVMAYRWQGEHIYLLGMLDHVAHKIRIDLVEGCESVSSEDL